MANTVFSNGSGLFHKGSGGTGKAFPDVCLSPPPAPTGPVPVPYPNSLAASDLADGSKTVKIQGKPTALEDSSSISTSKGDEGGNQGGNVVTHKTKGKGYFQLWSFDVKIEGKGVDRDGDPIGQNCASGPPGSPTIRAKVNQAFSRVQDCPRPYNRHTDRGSNPRSPTPAQTAHVNTPPNNVCPCGSTKGPMTADHKPQIVVIYYFGGCKDLAKMEQRIKRNSAVQAQCPTCLAGDGGPAGHFSRMINELYKAAGVPGF
ncbi:MAG: DUF4150 domain-containing protein [Planctomycetota bacterium]|jgi:uncharacterized Zn-binding protein involved in type VI secretion